MKETIKNFLQPKAGFDWNRVKWGGPHDRRADCCSYCGLPFPAEDDRTPDFFPLILWTKTGAAAEFCNDCQREWFGIWAPDPEENAAE